MCWGVGVLVLGCCLEGGGQVCAVVGEGEHDQLCHTGAWERGGGRGREGEAGRERQGGRGREGEAGRERQGGRGREREGEAGREREGVRQGYGKT